LLFYYVRLSHILLNTVLLCVAVLLCYFHTILGQNLKIYTKKSSLQCVYGRPIDVGAFSSSATAPVRL